MIVAAGLLVLVGLGLFVAGVFTGVTTLYWACVGACVVAAVLLFVARRRMDASAAAAAPAAARGSAAAAAGAREDGSTGRHAGGSTAPGRSAPAADGPSSTDAAAPVQPAATLDAGAVPAAPAGATPASDGAAARAGTAQGPADAGEPPVEEVEVTDLLLVVDLTDEVLVVDEHPRYHVAGCRHLAGRETIPIPLDEARTDGFTPCGTCRPDATLADRVRARK